MAMKWKKKTLREYEPYLNRCRDHNNILLNGLFEPILPRDLPTVTN